MARGKRDGLLVAGGGLSGCLAALAMARKRPDVPILLVEEKERFGGEHDWSFLDPEVSDEDRWLIEPVIERQWEGYYVAFPGNSRKFRTGCGSIPAGRLDTHVREVLGPDRYRLGTRIAAVREREIVLTDGETIKADGALDARGAANLSMLDLGWRKFVGRDYRFERPHGLDRPVLIDATVEQGASCRFVTCLPLDEERMRVEDNVYSDGQELDRESGSARLEAYVRKRRWAPGVVERETSGVLPVALGGDFDAYLRIGGARVARLGLRGGLFQPTTGSPLPDAIRAAAMLTRQQSFDGAELHELFSAHALKLWKQRAVHRTFDSGLIRGAGPEKSCAALESLYRLPGSLIERFHAGKLSTFDRMRVLRGGG